MPFGHLAQSLRAARQHLGDRDSSWRQARSDIDLLTLEIHDVIQLLDARCIRDGQPTDKPPFPGHDESWRRNIETAGDEAPATYASFLHATYGIGDPQTLRAAAIAMRGGDKAIPGPLTDLLWQLEQIVLAAEHPTRGEH